VRYIIYYIMGCGASTADPSPSDSLSLLGRAWLEAVSRSGLTSETFPMDVVVGCFRAVDKCLETELCISSDLPDMVVLSTKYAGSCNTLSDYFTRQMFRQGLDVWSPNTTSYKALMERLCPDAALMAQEATSWTLLYSLMLIRVKKLVVLVRAPKELHGEYVDADFLLREPLDRECFNSGQRFEISLASALISAGFPITVVFTELCNGYGVQSTAHAEAIAGALRASDGAGSGPAKGSKRAVAAIRGSVEAANSSEELSLVVHAFSSLEGACMYNMTRLDGTRWALVVGQIESESSPFVEVYVRNCDGLEVSEWRRGVNSGVNSRGGSFELLATMRGMQHTRQHVSYSRGLLTYGVENGGVALGGRTQELRTGTVAELEVADEPGPGMGMGMGFGMGMSMGFGMSMSFGGPEPAVL